MPQGFASLLERTRTLAGQGRLDEALAHIDQGFATLPQEHGRLHYLRGSLLLERRMFLAALPHFAYLARHFPDNDTAWLCLGQCHLNTGHGMAALDAFAHVRGPFAQSAQMFAFRASATAQTGDDGAALALYERALALDADNYDAWFGSALLFDRRREPDRAERAYARAHELRPSSNWALGNRVSCLQNMADWPPLAAPEKELLARLSRGDFGDYAGGLSNLDLDGATLRRLAAHTMRAQSALHVVPQPARRFGPRRPGRLRIGYVSADFRDHATSRLLVEVLERHDRAQLETFGYALAAADDSALGRRIVAAFEHFIDVAQAGPDEIAARLLADGIDVMVDLHGHTKGARVGLHALRPAPVVVNWLGYPGTLGDYTDYIVGDAQVTPPGSEAEFSESIVRLPGSYQPNDRHRDVGAATTRAAHGLPEAAIVACSFNQIWKITPEVWRVWMRAMAKQPRAVLWLLDENRWASANLREAARAHGVEAARIHFAPRVPQRDHLARLALADLALDTLPCNSHTTGSDALWLGVPLLTQVGGNFAGRVGASLLHAVGLPELIARDEEDYAARLDALLAVPARLAALKRTLLAVRESAPLFDAQATARALERAWRAMHERHLAGLPPAAIRIGAADMIAPDDNPT